MKKTLLLILILFAVNSISFGTTRIITVQDFNFSPISLNANVGDTIVWQWVSGVHTTTSTTVPASASTWDQPITSTNTSYSYKITVAGTYNYQCTRHAAMNMVGSIISTPSSVSQIGTTVTSFELKQNYPNPFNPTTNINFSIPKSELVKISIYNVIGQEVNVILNENLNAGIYSVKFDASQMSSGIYFYKISAGEFIDIKRMVLMK
jgi:plastocyanin